MPEQSPTGARLPVSRRERRKILTRADLLLAGRKLFSDKGLYESRIEDLTNSAGIAKGTLYQYFDGRDDLILAVVADGYQELRRHVEARLRGARSLEDAVRRQVEAHLTFFEQNRDLMGIFHQVRGLLKFDQERWRGLRLVLENHVEAMAQELACAPAGRRLRAPQRRTLALLLYGGVSGYVSVRAALDPRQPLAADPAGVTEAFVALVRRGGGETGMDRRGQGAFGIPTAAPAATSRSVRRPRRA